MKFLEPAGDYGRDAELASMTQQSRDLALNTDLKFKTREWTAQRVGWAMMALVVLAAAVGVFGVGPLSSASAQSGSALSAGYERFVRFQSATNIEVQLGAEAVQDGKAQLWISGEYLSAIDIERITPQPESVTTSADGLTYTFEVGEELPAPITIRVMPSQVGPHTGELGIPSGPRLRLNQFVFP